jgi:hypothetical protein
VEPKVADVLIDRLAEWGVHRIYGYPGDGINGLTGRRDDESDPEGRPGSGGDRARARLALTRPP